MKIESLGQSLLSLTVEKERTPEICDFEERGTRVTRYTPNGWLNEGTIYSHLLRRYGPRILLAFGQSDYDMGEIMSQNPHINTILQPDIPNFHAKVVVEHGIGGLWGHSDYRQNFGSYGFAPHQKSNNEAIGVEIGQDFKAVIKIGFMPGESQYFELGRDPDGKMVRLCFRDGRGHLNY